MSAKKPKKQTKHDVLAGLKAGNRYMRRYIKERGGITGIEKLIPIGSGPAFTRVRRICKITSEDPVQTNSGIEEIDDDFVDTVIENGRWVQF